MRSRVLVVTTLLTAACAQIPDQLDSKQFDFNTHALSFANFGDRYEGGKFNTDLAIRMFGADAVCLPNMTECVVDPNIQVFIDDVNNSLASGHSEGFAVVAQLFAMGKLNSADFGAARPIDLTIGTDSILRELAYYAATQRIEAVHAGDKKLNANDAMQFLAEAFKPSNTEGYRMMVAIKKADGSFSAGHAVVPFGYFKGEKDGQYVVRLYDPNFPQTEKRREVDVKAGSWRYDGTFDPNDPLIYEGTKENENLLYFSPVSARLGTFTPPHASEGFAVTLGGGTGLITGDENEVGFKDGKVVEKGGLVLPGAANCACSNSNAVVQMLIKKAGLPQTVTLTATGATVTGNNVTVQVDDYANKGRSYNTEAVTVTPDGKAVVTHTGVAENDPRTVTVTTKNKDGSTTSVTITTSGNTESVTIDTSDPNNVKVTGKSSANLLSSEVTVTVTNTKPDGTKKTVTSTSSAGEGRNIDVSVQPLSGTAVANTGLPADSCKNGRRDTNEAMTDCGSACAMKPPADRIGSGRCARYSRCFSDGDCAVGDSCWKGACWEPQCNDGLKNGNETDIDCGGSPCGGCWLDKTCLGSNNCANGFLCDNGKCAQATPLKHRVTITGLAELYLGLEITSSSDGVRSVRKVNGNATGAPFDVEFSAGKTFRASITSPAYGFKCAFDGPRDSPEWAWVWDAPPTMGTGMSSRKSITCYRDSGEVQIPFVISGCIFKGGPKDGGVYVPSSGAPKFYNNLVTPAEEMNWVYFGTGSNSAFMGPYGSLRQSLRSTNGVPRYNISIGPDTSGFCKYDRSFYAEYDQDSPVRYTMSCLPDAPLQGTLGVVDPTIAPKVYCNCTITYPDAGPADAGVDAGPVDAGFDAGRPDSGVDAGRPDAGFDAGFDAGRPDSGFDAGVDAGPVDAGPAVCSNDSQCGAGANCFCLSDPGNCAGAGLCLGTKTVISTPTTDGVAASGTYTVPAGCSKVHISAWGASGGKYSQSIPFPVQLAAGAGGFAAGAISAAPGDQIRVWVGTTGIPTEGIMGNEGIGSYAGTPANGGDGDGIEAGGGGGLTSVAQTGSVSRTFAIPGGAGASATGLAQAGGDITGGGATGRSGQSAMVGSTSGGGGAGDPGGLAGTAGQPGKPGAFGTLPSGITSSAGNLASPGGSSRFDYGLCPSGTAQGMSNGNGCVVVRCAQ